MSTPTAALMRDLASVDGDIMVLGVGGRMGPTLARMAKRAAASRRVIGVARFSKPELREKLEAQGIECITADLLSREALAALPEVPNIVFMAGRKFGSKGSEWLTWAMNAHLPALVAERFHRARIVAFSTACVYPLSGVTGKGAREDAAPTPPPGEYANSCVARERMFEHFSHQYDTPGRLLRLSHAVDMRYGVLHALAKRILKHEPIDLAIGHANIIWQGDANESALRALKACTTPTSALNVGGPMFGMRAAAEGLGERLGITPVFAGREADTAWLIDCARAAALFGAPGVDLETLLDWTADWVGRGLGSPDKPTRHEARDGNH